METTTTTQNESEQLQQALNRIAALEADKHASLGARTQRTFAKLGKAFKAFGTTLTSKE